MEDNELFQITQVLAHYIHALMSCDIVQLPATMNSPTSQIHLPHADDGVYEDYYYEKGIFKKRVQGISHNGDGNIDVITQIGYRDFSEAKVGDLIWEGFYKNGGMIEERHIIQEILSKEGNQLKIIRKEISYDKEGNKTSTKTEEDSL